MLAGPYQCGWLFTLRDAIFVGDDQLAAESIDRLRTEIASNPAMIEVRQYVTEALDKAELGDPGPVQMLIDINLCEQIAWITATPESSSSLPPSRSGYVSQSAIVAALRLVATDERRSER